MAAGTKDEVTKQWAEEAAVQQVRRPVPHTLRWSSTAREVAASRRVVLGEDTDLDWRDAPLSGAIEQLVEVFLDRLPHRQLVVLGVPGAGKTALSMLFTLGVLDRPTGRAGARAAADRVVESRGHPSHDQRAPGPHPLVKIRQST